MNNINVNEPNHTWGVSVPEYISAGKAVSTDLAGGPGCVVASAGRDGRVQTWQLGSSYSLENISNAPSTVLAKFKNLSQNLIKIPHLYLKT